MLPSMNKPRMFTFHDNKSNDVTLTLGEFSHSECICCLSTASAKVTTTQPIRFPEQWHCKDVAVGKVLL